MGKSSTTSVTNQTSTPSLDPAQRAAINAQTNLLTGTIAPTYQNAVTGATNLYNQEAAGYANAAQQYGQTANQAMGVLGTGGQSAFTQGTQGLENLFSPDYEQQQMSAALMPAQAQYQQNVAAQGAQFGGAGQLGSARQALADRQLAQGNEAVQAQIAAQVANNIAGQRMTAGQALMSGGMNALSNAQTAGANQLAAAGAPQNLYNQYAQVIFGTPQSSYNANFAGTQGGTISGTGSSQTTSFNLNPFAAAGMQMFSDRRLKKEIKFMREEGKHKIYRWKYIFDDSKVWEGVMADEVKKYMPEAVINVGGFDSVNYSLLGLTIKECV